jgi:hypothetical protein
MMSAWTNAVERKAGIIHSQLLMARTLAAANGANPDEVSEPYLSLLRTLYSEEFPFAQLTDTSDLVARFRGPAVDIHDPTISIVMSLFSDLREQIRSIAKSIVGLASDKRMLWPAQLDPHLAGVAHGSLLVGVSVSPPPSDTAKGHQYEIEGASQQVFESVRSAVRSLSLVAHYVSESGISEAIREVFPDPAVRDTVLVAARRLAPSGRRGIESVSFSSPESEQGRVETLTPKSRLALTQALVSPVKVSTIGSFDGLVREVDLDARRFEIRGVSGVGAVRCVYGPVHDEVVRAALDARVRVQGRYDTVEGQRPRFMAVDVLEVLSMPGQQLSLPRGEV